jgi:hypothetical protein
MDPEEELAVRFAPLSAPKAGNGRLWRSVRILWLTFFDVHLDPQPPTDREEDVTPRGKKRPREAPTIPRMLKNDIRRFYAPMFMNTINSGDLLIMQDFFYTFMTGSCRLVGDQSYKPEFQLPGRIIGSGPVQTSHYLLGTFLMYPDLVTKMRNCQLTTSNTWKGTKITLDVEVVGTKVATLPMEAWMPHKSCLPLIYAQPTVQHMVHLVRSNFPNYYDFSTRLSSNPAAQRADWPSVTVVAANEEGEISPGSYRNAGSSCTFSQPSCGAGTSDDRCDQSSEGTEPMVSSGSNTDFSVDNSADTSGSSSSSSKRPGKALKNSPHYIPASFIYTLSEGLQPLATPLSLHSVGRVEFYLDENNHVQLFNLSLVQLEDQPESDVAGTATDEGAGGDANTDPDAGAAAGGSVAASASDGTAAESMGGGSGGADGSTHAEGDTSVDSSHLTGYTTTGTG